MVFAHLRLIHDLSSIVHVFRCHLEKGEGRLFYDGSVHQVHLRDILCFLSRTWCSQEGLLSPQELSANPSQCFYHLIYIVLPISRHFLTFFYEVSLRIYQCAGLYASSLLPWSLLPEYFVAQVNLVEISLKE